MTFITNCLVFRYATADLCFLVCDRGWLHFTCAAFAGRVPSRLSITARLHATFALPRPDMVTPYRIPQPPFTGGRGGIAEDYLLHSTTTNSLSVLERSAQFANTTPDPPPSSTILPATYDDSQYTTSRMRFVLLCLAVDTLCHLRPRLMVHATVYEHPDRTVVGSV